MRRAQPPPGNRIEPGATLFTRILSGASSFAKDFVILILGGFRGVIGNVSSALPAVDGGYHQDDPAALLFHFRDREPVHALQR